MSVPTPTEGLHSLGGHDDESHQHEFRECTDILNDSDNPDKRDVPDDPDDPDDTDISDPQAIDARATTNVQNTASADDGTILVEEAYEEVQAIVEGAHVNTGSTSSSSSNCSISSAQEMALKNLNDEYKFTINMSRMPGYYAPDGSSFTLKYLVFAFWILVSFALGFVLGFVTEDFASKSPRIALWLYTAPATSTKSTFTLTSTPSAPTPPLTRPSPGSLQPRLAACQQLCGNQSGSWLPTDRRLPRDWLHEADLGLEALNKLLYSQSLHVANSSMPRSTYAHNVLTCQDQMQELWDAADSFRLQLQHLVTCLTHLDYDGTSRWSLRSFLTNTPLLHHFEGSHLYRNNKQLDQAFALEKSLHDIPFARVHHQLKIARLSINQLIQNTSKSKVTEGHTQLAISVEVALGRFCRLFEHAEHDLHAAASPLRSFTNATAHFDGNASISLGSLRHNLDALIVMW